MKQGLAAWHVAGVAVTLLAACGEPGTVVAGGPADGPDEALPGAPVFHDATAGLGISFMHFTGATGHYYFPEIMGSGAAVFDYANDGDLDIYLLQGSMVLPGDDVEDALIPPASPPRNRLYRNDLVIDADGRRSLGFTDVTAAAGVGDDGYAMGCAVADYDNDGDQDLYVTNYGPNVFYRNDGDGTFARVEGAAGADDPRWSTSASFADLDRDGLLDLVVVNYVAASEDMGRACRRSAGDRDYCTPLTYRPQPDSVFRNQGDGTFADVTGTLGLDTAFGNGLGVVAADLNQDGWLDIYVANDGVPNQLWLNREGLRFDEAALLSGTAVNQAGDAEAGMGVTVSDFDQDGDEDILVSHLFGETNTLYVNQGQGVFEDQTDRHALGSASRAMTGFGAQFFDYDGDGFDDLMIVNGAVSKVDSRIGDPWPYGMPNQLFRGGPDGRYVDVSQHAGAMFAAPESSRGLALGDLDLDGDIDAVLTNNNGPARVLINSVGAENHWLQVKLEGRSANRDGLGAYVGLERADGTVRYRRVHTDGSYLSATDRSVHFGLGKVAAPVTLIVRWPGGDRERWPDISIDQAVTLRQGEGQEIS